MDPQLAAKKVSTFQLAVKVVDEQSNNLPFFVIKGGEECMDSCPQSCTSLGSPNDFALKWANHSCPSLRESLGCQTMLLTCTSPLMAIALEQKTVSIISMRFPAVP